MIESSKKTKDNLQQYAHGYKAKSLNATALVLCWQD